MGVVTKTFRAGNSEAVRLPKELGFGEGVEVELTRQGDTIVIRRKQLTGKELVEALDRLPKPTSVQKRQKILFPKRPGL